MRPRCRGSVVRLSQPRHRSAGSPLPPRHAYSPGPVIERHPTEARPVTQTESPDSPERFSQRSASRRGTIGRPSGDTAATSSAHRSTPPLCPYRESASSVVDAATIMPSTDSGVSALPSPAAHATPRAGAYAGRPSRRSAPKAQRTQSWSTGSTGPRPRSLPAPNWEFTSEHALGFGCNPPSDTSTWP